MVRVDHHLYKRVLPLPRAVIHHLTNQAVLLAGAIVLALAEPSSGAHAAGWLPREDDGLFYRKYRGADEVDEHDRSGHGGGDRVRSGSSGSGSGGSGHSGSGSSGSNSGSGHGANSGSSGGQSGSNSGSSGGRRDDGDDRF
jgi:hypothetical protein